MDTEHDHEAVEPEPDAPTNFGRRRLLAGAGATLFGGGFLVGRWSKRGPRDRVDVGSIDEILATIRADGHFPFSTRARAGEDDAPDHAVVAWDPSVPEANALYGQPENSTNVFEKNPVVNVSTGLLVLFLRSTHRGCLSRYCESSGWFEDPCHGSRWNRWGEWTGGPAPRGLDRHKSEIVDGRLLVDLEHVVPGVAREVGVLRQDPEGPNCLDL